MAMKRSRSLSCVRRKRMRIAPVPRPEVKEYIGSGALAVPAFSFSFSNLVLGLAAGTGPGQRIGNKIRMKSIEVYGSFGPTLALPITATLFNSKSVTAFNSVDFNGPLVFEDSGSNYAVALSGQSGGNTFRFTKTFPGGKILTFDKDTGNPTHHAPAVLFTNPGAVASSSGIIWWRIKFTDP